MPEASSAALPATSRYTGPPWMGFAVLLAIYLFVTLLISIYAAWGPKPFVDFPRSYGGWTIPCEEVRAGGV